MIFSALVEAVDTQDPTTRAMSGMVSTVNALTDLLSAEGGDLPKDFLSQASQLARALDWHRRRLDRANVSDELWADIRPAQAPATYDEFRAVALNGAAKAAVSSLRDLVERPVSKGDVRLTLAQSRVANLQSLIIGSAPGGEIQAAAAPAP